MEGMTRQDDVNRDTWAQASSRTYLQRRDGFLPGEREPFAHVAARLGGRPVLELGCGTGRTMGFTSALSDDYRALDYLPEMVEACRAAHPRLRVDLGDARTLDGVPDGYFGLVTFAWNGIDAVSHADRALVLAAVRRVLAPGGMFFFSTLNLDGPDLRERPWHVPLAPSKNPLVFAVRAAKAARYVAQNCAHWMRLQPLVERGPGYAVAPLPAHGYGILAHYTTLGRQLVELADAGFAPDAQIFASVTGAPVTLEDDTSAIDYFHIITRAP